MPVLTELYTHMSLVPTEGAEPFEIMSIAFNTLRDLKYLTLKLIKHT